MSLFSARGLCGRNHSELRKGGAPGPGAPWAKWEQSSRRLHTRVTLDQRPHLLTQFPPFCDGATRVQGRWSGWKRSPELPTEMTQT